MSLLLALAFAAGQPAAAAPPAAPAGMTRAQDEYAIARAIGDVYAVISGPAGKARDWERMKTLFTSDARLYAISTRRGLSGGTLADYIANNGPVLERIGFTEKELARRVEIYGNLAQVWSSYQASSSDGSVNMRGINSFQLARQPDGRWLVHSILWQQENPSLKIPSDMEAR